MLTLVSDVATSYFRLLEFDRELAIAQESSKTYKQTLDLFTQRFQFGRDSKLPVARAQAAYDSSIASIASLKRAIAQQENALSVFLGAYPEGLKGELSDGQSTPTTPLGLTTDVLQRRPDILQAEQNMIGANAEIGVAVANFFPRIGLQRFMADKVRISATCSNQVSASGTSLGASPVRFFRAADIESYYAQQASGTGRSRSTSKRFWWRFRRYPMR